ncbi:MAG: GNAT family N-acetyltransferase [Myxococcota bacterium]
MSTIESRRAARQVVEALAAGSVEAFAEHIADHAILRLWRWDGREQLRPRDRLFRHLAAEWAAWDTPILEILSIVVEGERAVVEFRVQTSADGVPIEHNRMLSLSGNNNSSEAPCFTSLDLYCAAPVLSAGHSGHIAARERAAGATDRLLAALRYSNDTRHTPLQRDFVGRYTLHCELSETDSPHPGANTVRVARLGASDADAHIAAIIEHFRRQNHGFQWIVGFGDSPADLGQRLLAHGMVHAGDVALLIRSDLSTETIPNNSQVSIDVVDPDDDDTLAEMLYLLGRSFQWPADRVAQFRGGWSQHMRERRNELTYVARLDGRIVAMASWASKAGLALLSGGATLPEFRGQGIYSTLLRRRLDDARARGLTLVAVEAQPMSRRILQRYGFVDRCVTGVYAWMPVIDMDVIRTLIQTGDD